jgi:hypothetical protein
VLGGYSDKSKDEIERLNREKSNKISKDVFSYNTLYNLTIFDTISNGWENVNTKSNIFNTSVVNFIFNHFLAIVYNDKIIVFGGFVRENETSSVDSSSYMCILDFNSKTWAWKDIFNYEDSGFKDEMVTDL